MNIAWKLALITTDVYFESCAVVRFRISHSKQLFSRLKAIDEYLLLYL